MGGSNPNGIGIRASESIRQIIYLKEDASIVGPSGGGGPLLAFTLKKSQAVPGMKEGVRHFPKTEVKRLVRRTAREKPGTGERSGV